VSALLHRPIGSAEFSWSSGRPVRRPFSFAEIRADRLDKPIAPRLRRPFILLVIGSVVALGAVSHLTPAPTTIAPAAAAERSDAGPGGAATAGEGTAAQVVGGQAAAAARSVGSADAVGERAAVGLAASGDAAPISGSGDATASAAEVATVMSLAGSGQAMSEPFTVDGSSEIAWDHQGSHLFSLQLIPADSGNFGTLIVSEVGSSSGQSPVYVQGKFTLRAVSADDWSVRVVDLSSPPTAGFPATFKGSGPSNSPSFTTTRPWLLQWTLDRDATISIDLAPLTAKVPTTVLVDAMPRAGCAFVSDLGAFYLSVDTDASWHIQTSTTDGEVVCPVP
jgi:hypothetical protein